MVETVHRETFIFDGLMTSVIDRKFVDVLRATGINAVHYTVANMSLVEGELLQDNFSRACRRIATWFRKLDELKEHIGLATSVRELQDLHAQGRIAILFGMQNASPIEDDVDLLDVFYRLGIRFVQLTYNSRNLLGSGSGEPQDAGLSELGVRAVQRMNELGMVIDLSHCGYQTTLEAIELSEDPVAFTHANVRSLAATPRNKSDEQLRALAEKGGVVGVKHMLGDMISKPADQTSYVDVVDHLEYLVELIGIDHVSIGTDFRGTTIPSPTKDAELAATRRRWANAYLGRRAAPKGFESVTELPNLTGELIKRGYTSADIGKIYGGNLIRLLTTVFR